MHAKVPKTSALKNTIDSLSSFQFYKPLFHNSSDAVIIIDLNGEIVYASPAASAMFGHEKPEAMHRTKALSLIPPEYHNQALTRLKEAFSSGFSPPNTHELLTKEHKRFNAESSISILRDNMGLPVGFITITRGYTPGQENLCSAMDIPHGFKTISARPSTPCLLVDSDFVITLVNKECAVLTGFSGKELEGKSLSELLSGKDLQHIVSGAHTEQERGISRSVRYHTSLKDKQDSLKQVMVSIFFNQGVNKNIVLIWDLAAVPATFDLLDEQETERDTIFEAIGQPAVILDPSFTILDANSKTAELLGNPVETLKGQKCYTVFHGIQKPPGGCPLLSAVKEHRFSSNEMKVQMLNGYYLVSCTPVYDSSDNILKIIHIATDVTEWHNTARELKLSEKRYKTLFENTGTAMCIVDENGGINACNKTFLQITNLERKDIENTANLCDFLRTTPKKTMPESHRKTQKLRFPFAPNIEAVLETPDRSTKYLYATTSKIPHTSQFIVSLTDITRLRKAEQKIVSQLNEKELLLKEIHHRVKNNLQVISSLLRLQSGRLTNKEIRDIFTDSQARIHSMALVHEELYKSADLSSIDVKVYVTNLVYYLFNSLNISHGSTKINITTDDIRLGIDQIITCGLIINELLTNSLKYAFPPSFCGPKILTLDFSLENKSMYQLIFSDNGVGIPEHINVEKSDSLGLRLINILARDQLGGSIQTSTEKGTSFTIRFPRE